MVLEPWQQEIVDAYPGPSSAGCSTPTAAGSTNWATRTVAGETKRYEYGRWQFVNHSTDIQRFCTDALDRAGHPVAAVVVEAVSVSRRDAVARLDAIVGPKS